MYVYIIIEREREKKLDNACWNIKRKNILLKGKTKYAHHNHIVFVVFV